MLEHIYNFPYNRVLYSDAEIQPMWELDYFGPIIALMKWHKKYEEDLKHDIAEGMISYPQRCRLEEEPYVVLHEGP
jgi:hypothetical protein